MKSNTKNNVSKHIKHASNGIPSQVLIRTFDKDENTSYTTKEKVSVPSSKKKIESNNVVFEPNEFQGEYSSMLHQESWNNQPQINNKKTSVKDKVAEIEMKIGANYFANTQRIVDYCIKHKLTPLSESKDKLSKQFYDYNKKLLDVVTQNSDLQPIAKDLTIVTTLFPDIIYGSGYMKDLNDHHKSANILEAHAKFLALAITTYYSRIFSNPVFTKHYFKSCSIKDKKEFIEINKQLNVAPLLQNIDLNSLSGISSKEELDEKIDVLYEKVLTEVSLINIKHEQTLLVLEKFIQQEELTEKLKNEYDLKSIEYENNINTIKSELNAKTQELQNAHEYTEKVIMQITIEFENKLEETKQNYEIAISKQKEEIDEQKEENKILKKVIEVTNENYEKMKLEFATLNKEFDIKANELTIKEKEIASIKKDFNLVKINKDELAKQLAAFESTKKTEVKTTVNKNLLTEEKLLDSDDESEEDDVFLLKPANKEKDKDDEVDDLFSLEANKKNLEFISTTNYTDNVNVALDTKDHVSCNGEDSFHSDTD